MFGLGPVMDQKSFVFRFGEFEVCESDMRLTRGGETLALEPKALRVLLYFLRNSGRLITKDELLNAVWGDTAVEENSLTRAISLLRRVLGDDVRAPRYIETAAAFGYRFVCKVETVSQNEKPQLPQSPEQKRPRLRWLIPLARTLLVIIVAAIWYLLIPLPPPKITEFVQLTHHDDQSGAIAAVDESRIYLNRFGPPKVAQLSAQGGEVVPLDLPLKDPFVINAPPDGSSLFVGSSGTDEVWKVGVPDRSLRLLTDLHQVWTDIAWSPDGKFIAYSTPDGDVYRVNSDWTGNRILFSTKGDKRGHPVLVLSWSPDGKKLSFTTDYEIWEISSEGTDARVVLSFPDPSHYICCGKWTSDGAFFLFLSGDSLLRSAPFIPAGDIWALDERSGRLRRPQPNPIPLTSGPIRWGIPFPSKDGKKIFSQGVVLRGRLERYDGRSHQFQPFLGGISVEFVEFSKDGKSVAYVTYPEGILWRADADGGNRIQLTDPPIYPKNPRWSPDGTQILFEDDVKGKGFVYIVPSAGGRPQRLLPERKEPWSDPNWSPDGSKIVYASCNCVNHGPAATPYIEILDLKANTRSRLPGSEHRWSPRWSPDGKFIVALGDRTPPEVYNFDTKRWTDIGIRSMPDFPTWSRDGRYIYFLRFPQDPQVFRVPITGGPQEKVADLNGYPLTGWYGIWMGLDPTDAPLTLRNIGTEDIYALTLDRK
jgi:DNA-binding winged helix-turn-helix (wHTH) protein/Tol biopolymer transport system component